MLRTCWQAIEFHHLNPEEKSFPLSVREMQFAWNRVRKEIEKCILVCSCCHREIHYGFINFEQVKQIWEERWTKIESSSTIVPRWLMIGPLAQWFRAGNLTDGNLNKCFA